MIFLSVLGVLLVLSLCAAAVVAVLGVITLWWYGIFMSLMVWTGAPLWGMILIGLVIGVLFFASNLVRFILTIFGFFGTLFILDWAWYWSFLLYLPALSILFSTTALAIVVGISFGVGKLLSHLVDSTRRRRK